MKVKELIEELSKLNQEAEVWTAAINKDNIPTYGLVDHIYEEEFDSFWSDLLPTPGDIDNRLIKNKKLTDKVVFIGTTFGR